MATVLETLQNEKAAMQAEIAKIELEISAIPSEFHSLEADLWAKLKSWFGTPAA